MKRFSPYLIVPVLVFAASCHSPTDVTRIAKVSSVTYQRDRPADAPATRGPSLTLWHLRIGDALKRSDEINCALDLIDEDTFACTRTTPLDWNVPLGEDNTIWVDDSATGSIPATSRIRVNGTLLTRIEGNVAKFRISSNMTVN
jgi:hypothetical protein